MLDRAFEPLQRAQVVQIKIEAMSLDSTRVKVPADGKGARGKNRPQALGQSRGGRNTQIPLVAADARTAMTFPLSPGLVRHTTRPRAPNCWNAGAVEPPARFTS